MPVNVTDMLHSTALDGKLAETVEIFDPSQGRFQNVINSKTLESLVIKYNSNSNSVDIGLDDLRPYLQKFNPSKNAIVIYDVINNTNYHACVKRNLDSSGNIGSCYIYWILCDNLVSRILTLMTITVTSVRLSISYTEIDLYPASSLGDDYLIPISQKTASDELAKRQLKPSIEGSAGQVLTKTGPNPGDVKWVTPSSSASPYERISQADVVSVFQLDDDPDVPSGGGSLTLAGELADNTRIMIVGHVKIKDSAGVTTCYALSATYPVPLDSEVHIFDHGGTFVSATISGTTMTIYLETVNRDDCPEVTVTITGIYKLTI